MTTNYLMRLVREALKKILPNIPTMVLFANESDSTALYSLSRNPIPSHYVVATISGDVVNLKKVAEKLSG